MTAPAAVGWNRPHEMLTISIRTPSRNQNDLAAHSRCLRWVKPNHSPPGGLERRLWGRNRPVAERRTSGKFSPTHAPDQPVRYRPASGIQLCAHDLGAWRMACISASATAGQIAVVTACRARRSARCAHNARHARCRRLVHPNGARLPGGAHAPVSTDRAALCVPPSPGLPR